MVQGDSISDWNPSVQRTTFVTSVLSSRLYGDNHGAKKMITLCTRNTRVFCFNDWMEQTLESHFDLDNIVPSDTLHYYLTIYQVAKMVVEEFLDWIDYPSTTILNHLQCKIIWECHCNLPWCAIEVCLIFSLICMMSWKVMMTTTMTLSTMRMILPSVSSNLTTSSMWNQWW